MKMLQVNHDTFPIFRQFVHYYMNEIYDYISDLQMDRYGNYQYGGIEDYLTDPHLKAFLIYEDDVFKGFLMLNGGRYTPKGYDYCIQEFYVAKPYRHQGIAHRALEALFNYYKGKYFVMQLEKNLPAIRFWHHYYDENEIAYVEKRIQVDSEWCLTQTFLII